MGNYGTLKCILCHVKNRFDIGASSERNSRFRDKKIAAKHKHIGGYILPPRIFLNYVSDTKAIIGSKHFLAKDPIPGEIVVYKFTCAGCNSCYVGETRRHLTTRIMIEIVYLPGCVT